MQTQGELVAMVARIVYLVASVVLAIYAFNAHGNALPQYKNETLLAVTIVLYLAALPLSVVYGVVFGYFAEWLQLEKVLPERLAFWFAFEWLPMVALGYVQWFLALPWLRHRFRQRYTR
jgi:small-conductance mechanosensitive channel